MFEIFFFFFDFGVSLLRLKEFFTYRYSRHRLFYLLIICRLFFFFFFYLIYSQFIKQSHDRNNYKSEGFELKTFEYITHRLSFFPTLDATRLTSDFIIRIWPTIRTGERTHIGLVVGRMSVEEDVC